MSYPIKTSLIVISIASSGSLLCSGCAEDSKVANKQATYQNGNQNPGYDDTYNPGNSQQNYDPNRYSGGTVDPNETSDALKDDYDYPSFLLRGKGTMQHKSGQVNLTRKITYKINEEFQETILDVMVAVSGNYAKQVNESMINNGVSSNLLLKSTRASESDVTQAQSSNSGYEVFKAYLYATKLEKVNTFKNETFVWNASQPIPIGVRPGSSAIFKLLQQNGAETYETKITGEKNFTLKTTIQVVSLTDNEAVLKMTNTALNDPSGQLMNNFPLPEEQIVTVDTSKKEISKYSTKSFYIDSSNNEKYYSNLTYEICAFKKGGELTVYTMCNY